MAVRRSFWLALMVVIAASAPYVGTLDHDLLSDDPSLVREVERLYQEGGLRRILTADFRLFPTVPLGYYRPVVLLSIWVDTRIGIPPPLSYHATNLLLHVVNSVLVLLIARNLLRSDAAALLSGLLFAVHPVHVDAVAPIAGRTDLWSAMFILLATLAWSSDAERIRPMPFWILLVGSVAVVLSALSKELGFLGPMVLGIWHIVYHYSRGGAKKVLSMRRPWLLAWSVGLGIAITLRWLAVGFRGVDTPLAARGDLGLYIGIWARYFRLLLMPWPLNAFYTPDQVSLDVLTGLAAVAVLVLYASLSIRRYDHIGIIALVWTVIFLMPVSGIVTLPAAVLAERFLYVPSAIFCISLGLILHHAWSVMRSRRMVAMAITFIFMAACTLTYARCRDWHDPLSFYLSLVHTSPRYAGGFDGLGQALEQLGRRDEAFTVYKKSLDLDPGRASSYNSLGVLLANSEEFGESVPLFRKAVLLDPRFTEARMNLGAACLALRDRSCAIEQIEALRSLDAEAAARLQALIAEGDLRDRASR